MTKIKPLFALLFIGFAASAFSQARPTLGVLPLQ